MVTCAGSIMLRGLSICLVLALATASAAAQPDEGGDAPTASETALAREQFEQGMQFARSGHWEQAHTAFSRAYELVGRPAILLNLASAQAQTGRLVEAAESYRRFLREVQSGREARHREDAQRQLDELELRIPRARFMIEGLMRRDTIELDGAPLSQATMGAPLPVNPGRHVVVVRSGTVELARVEFEMPEGQGRDVRVEVDRSRLPAQGGSVPSGGGEPSGAGEPGSGQGGETRPGPDLDPTPDDGLGRRDEDDGGVLASPVFWTVVGVLVVGGVGAGILLSSDGGPAPHEGTLDPGRFTFP